MGRQGSMLPVEIQNEQAGWEGCDVGGRLRLGKALARPKDTEACICVAVDDQPAAWCM